MRPTLGRFSKPILAASLALSTTLLLQAPPAEAGIAQFRDSVGMLSVDDMNALRASASRYSFDVRVLSEASFTDRYSFDRYVGSQVSQPNMIVVGIDPMHRRTSVHFGRGVGIARSQFAGIENAGDPYFRSGQYRLGVEAILARAQTVVGTAPARSSTDGRGSALVVVVVLLAVGGLIAFALRRRNENGGIPIDPNSPYRAGGYGMPTTGYAPPGANYGYGSAPGHSTGTVVGAGLAGAAVGGLAGYAIGRAANGSNEYHNDGSGYSGASSSGYDQGSYDAGGSTSGWDDGGGGSFGGGDSGGSDW